MPSSNAAAYVAPITGVLVILSVVAAVALLAWHGSINGEAATGILSGIIGLGGGGAIAVGAHSAGASSATDAVREANLSAGARSAREPR